MIIRERTSGSVPQRAGKARGRPASLPVLPAVLDPFAENAAATVMVRLAVEWLIDEPTIERLFEDHADAQFVRELTLTHLVQIMLDVACGIRRSPRAAFLARQHELGVSASAFYGKLNRTELVLGEAVVHDTAQRAREVLVAADALVPEPIPGYATRIIDGNYLAGTEHRLEVLRALRAAGLPGMAVAVYEPASGLITDVILREDAYTQERALLEQVQIEPGQLWIGDRNFCVRKFLGTIHERPAFFLIREHRSLPWTATSELIEVGRTATGLVFEQTIVVPGVPGEADLPVRRIVVRLDHPTRNGDEEIVVLTNLPASVSALAIATAYLERWSIEHQFQVLTDLLHCEVPSLGYPRAALFAFAMSAVASQALALLLGHLREAHGPELVAELSGYALVESVRYSYGGMMVVLPAAGWNFVRTMSAQDFATVMTRLAAAVPVDQMQRHHRGPKKPRPSHNASGRDQHHVSTYRLLEAARHNRSPCATKAGSHA